MTLNQLLDEMWNDYCQFNPGAKRIYSAFTERGEKVVNDHIALRTLDHPKLGIASLASHFEKLGYKAMQDYTFPEKKLKAWHYEHSTDPSQPKIFISQLELNKMSAFVQETLVSLANQVADKDIQSPSFCMMGRPWKVSYATYQKLAQESEYAAWVAAYGFRPNHFTVSVNQLKTLKTLPEVNQFVKSLGFKLNTSGGEIKGSPAQLLEQSSTMAEETMVKFTEGLRSIPACYYEFALRHPGPDGRLYQGFVETSADKIFESTNRS